MPNYKYRVVWSDSDKQFVGLCNSFPSLSWLDDNEEDALTGIEKLVQDAVVDMIENGELLPEVV